MALVFAAARFALLASILSALLVVNAAPVAADGATQLQRVEQTALER